MTKFVCTKDMMPVYEKVDMSWSYMKLWGLDIFSLTSYNHKLYFSFFPRTLVIIYFYRDEIKSFLSLLINRYKPDSAGWQSSLHDADMLRIQIITSEDYLFVQLVLSFEMFTRDRRQ